MMLDATVSTFSQDFISVEENEDRAWSHQVIATKTLWPCPIDLFTRNGQTL